MLNLIYFQSNHTTISKTIDRIIQRAIRVEAYKDYFKLLSASLTRLRDKFDATNTADTENDIRRILEAIEEIVENSNEQENNPNRCLLLRLYRRICQHEADLTNDYQTKVQILSNACQQEKLIMENVLNKTRDQQSKSVDFDIRQRCNTIDTYLQNCLQIQNSVTKIELVTDQLINMTQTLYDISNEQSQSMRHPWQLNNVPFNQTLIKLRYDKLATFRFNFRSSLFSELYHNLLEYEENDITVENILQLHQWIVILGDPGSGKTSFVRYFIYHTAQALLNGQQTTQYGSIRIPILVSLYDFAQILQRKPTLTLFDYLTKTLDHQKALVLKDYITNGQATIIFDGLDQIPTNSKHRQHILDVIETSIGSSSSTMNQLIVTSRPSSYYASPLSPQFTPFIIQPLTIDQTKKFIDRWFTHVHQQILDSCQ